MTITLSPQTIHLWQVYLPDWFDQKTDLSRLLNETELQRAHRFKFETHCKRFIIARAFLKKILNLYTQISPEKIEFNYGNRGKPYLRDQQFDLQFNVSHSEDIAIYAIAHHAEVGVDVEKIKDKFKDAVAKRFFSKDEYTSLTQLPPEQRGNAFFQIWVKKEAIIKALGEGLYASLSDFTVNWNQADEELKIYDTKLYLHAFDAGLTYPAACAMRQPIVKVTTWKWLKEGYKEEKYV